MTLACFDIYMAKDVNGEDVKPVVEYTTEFIRYLRINLSILFRILTRTWRIQSPEAVQVLDHA